MKNKQEKKTCNDKGEWGNFIYNPILFTAMPCEVAESHMITVF